MVARFILSLDCEGKWGVADHLTPAHKVSLSDARLRKAYESILALLEEFEIQATFAFVGAFSLSPSQIRRLSAEFIEFSREVPGYLEHAIADMEVGTKEGWSGEWAVQAVRCSRVRHEIALHGATHIPWDWPGMTLELARKELSWIYEARAPILAETTTFVFPRNACRFPWLLDEFGLAGFRRARSRSGALRSLISEFNLFEKPEAVAGVGRPLGIPAGFFVNWQKGVRRLVPARVSRARARLLLERASRTGETVHYWTHPENIASAPATLSLLRGILEAVVEMRDKGLCEVVTQDGLCRLVDPVHVSESVKRRDALLADSSLL